MTINTENGAIASAEAATTDFVTSSPCKRLKYQPPDVVVTIGSGDTKREFECYAVVLCFASIVFDTMLSVKMKERATHRIAFPDKDPKEWELFYSFIDPSTCRKAKIGKSRPVFSSLGSMNFRWAIGF